MTGYLARVKKKTAAVSGDDTTTKDFHNRRSNRDALESNKVRAADVDGIADDNTVTPQETPDDIAPEPRPYAGAVLPEQLALDRTPTENVAPEVKVMRDLLTYRFSDLFYAVKDGDSYFNTVINYAESLECYYAIRDVNEETYSAYDYFGFYPDGLPVNGDVHEMVRDSGLSEEFDTLIITKPEYGDPTAITRKRPFNLQIHHDGSDRATYLRRVSWNAYSQEDGSEPSWVRVVTTLPIRSDASWTIEQLREMVVNTLKRQGLFYDLESHLPIVLHLTSHIRAMQKTRLSWEDMLRILHPIDMYIALGCPSDLSRLKFMYLYR